MAESANKKKWLDPVILDMEALPRALGLCLVGNTATVIGTCGNGQVATSSCTNGAEAALASCNDGGLPVGG